MIIDEIDYCQKKVAQVPGALIVQEIVLENYFKE